MAFPAVQATNTTNGTAASASAVVNLPAGIVAGDLLLVLHRSADGTALHAVSGGGWTNLFNDNSDASNDRISLWYRQADGTEGATITITQTSSKFASLAWRITGHEDPAVQAPEFATLVTGTSALPDPGAVTPTGGAKDYLFLWMGGWEGEQTSPPAGNPTNYASPFGADSGTGGAVATNCRVASASRALNAASEDPGSWTISASDDWTATVLAVHPAPVLASVEELVAATPMYGGTEALFRAVRDLPPEDVYYHPRYPPYDAAKLVAPTGVGVADAVSVVDAAPSIVARLTLKELPSTPTRTRYQASGVSDCAPADPGGTNRALDPGIVIGPTDLPISVPGLSVDFIAFAFTTPAGDPGFEDLAAALWTAVLNVQAAGAALAYKVRFRAIDDVCGLLNSADQAEPDFTGTGLKTATRTWDPSNAAERYQILVLVTNSGIPAQTLTLRVDDLGSFVDIPGRQAGGVVLADTPSVKVFLTVSDAVALADAVATKVIIAVADAVALADAAPSIAADVPVSDAVGVADASPAVNVFLTVADVAALADTPSVKVFVAITDAVALADTVTVVEIGPGGGVAMVIWIQDDFA